jgi:hypothetical protein
VLQSIRALFNKVDCIVYSYTLCYILGARGRILRGSSRNLVEGSVGHLKNKFQVQLLEANCIYGYGVMTVF